MADEMEIPDETAWEVPDEIEWTKALSNRRHRRPENPIIITAKGGIVTLLVPRGRNGYRGYPMSIEEAKAMANKILGMCHKASAPAPEEHHESCRTENTPTGT